MANAQINLTAMRSPEQIMRGLFLDSLTILPALRALPGGPDLNAGCSLVDVGTGAGVPGLPLEIMSPRWQALLIESTAKKAAFVRRVAGELDLENVVVLPRRAEEVGRMPEWRDRADICVARAVAPLPALIELCAPLVHPDGLMLFPKGEDVQSELSASREACAALRVRLERVHVTSPYLGLGEHRAIAILRKVGPTPPGYPRRVGLATSRSLGSPARPKPSR